MLTYATATTSGLRLCSSADNRGIGNIASERTAHRLSTRQHTRRTGGSRGSHRVVALHESRCRSMSLCGCDALEGRWRRRCHCVGRFGAKR